jgi:hypothetical protein
MLRIVEYLNGRRFSRVTLLALVPIVAVVVLLASSAASTTARRLSTRVAAQTRYSLVHGCYALSAGRTGPALASAYGPFRMQAAALGVYLLYEPNGDYLASAGGGALAGAATPSTAAEWGVTGTPRRGFTLTNLGTGSKSAVAFLPAVGCAVYPEAGIDATGRAFTGASAGSNVLGTVEGHAHVTAFELFGGDWHCGRPFSPFGAQYALPASCAPEEKGTNGEVESLVDFGGATRPSAMHGWPTFVDWPSPTALAEEGDYYTGIERAWMAGLRVMVTNLVDNEALCSLMTTRTNPCNDMSSVRTQSHDLYALQDDIDAQSGGPGKGFFRIVTTPFQARKVINEGKLAVIEGIEVSRIFGCGESNGVPQCNEQQIDDGLKQVHDLGVRTFFPIHEFNNAFGGTKMIAGDLGVLINAGNRLETGSFWNLQPCPADTQDAEQLSFPATGALGQLLNGPAASLLGGSPAPIYGSGPQCNTQGLTSLGAYVIQEMIRDHFIIQLDHMDSKTATAALAIATAAHYSGVVSAHCCSSPQLFEQIYGDGGFVSEPVAPAPAFATIERQDKADSDPRYHFGFGYGSDMNGLAEQPGPSSPSISYPFKSYLGHVTFGEEQWGTRSFDLNADGVANYGMYADWLRALQLSGGPSVMSDMFQGAESYLQMWERASGVPAMKCQAAGERPSAAGLGRSLRLGDGIARALYRAGQPLSRPGRTYRYCVAGQPRAAAVSVFGARGRVALIASDARAALRSIPRSAAQWLPHVWVGTAVLRGGARYVYVTRSGRAARYVAVAGRSALTSKKVLAWDLRAAAL